MGFESGDNMSERFSRVVRQCPICQNWWFDRMKHGCTIDSTRRTNTTADLSSEFAAGACIDFKPAVIKGATYHKGK